MTLRRLLAAGVLGATLAVAVGPLASDVQAAGDAERGRALFASKQCARCHVPRSQRGVGPALEELRRPQGAFELAGRFWNHAPGMFTVLTQESIEWPTLSEAEMADLMAYLKADPARDPAPDLFKGQVTLVQKGCLKCHSLRREGGRVGPDLASRRPVYASPTAWASSMWTHTPRMAQKAVEVGVLYPRFTSGEMGNLVGFLRSVAKSP